ncbi:MAG: Acyl-CoA thioesterase YbgC [Alphaproteobacteria bacterium MarineAlpha2_Bin1]|nr:MAG: Acyl-CoA thioesterase YbgC [Alphaproteobacteria bacterium MarineAlpha2_Bin1]
MIHKKQNILIRIYYEDTDSLGLVYYANYLRYFERARTEFFRSMGYELNYITDILKIYFVVRSCNLKFISPARFNDEIEVISRIKSLKKEIIQFDQKIELGGKLLVKSIINLACISQTGRAIILPNEIYVNLKKISD